VAASLAILLLAPQLPENVGAVARIMKNFGLKDLRVITPQCSLVDPNAIAVAAGADDILREATHYATITEAIGDLDALWATCGNERDGIKPYSPPEVAMREVITYNKPGILFGPERTGLGNDIIARCKAVIQIPTQPDFSSLNIAQSLAVIGYAWFQQQHTNQQRLRTGETRLATEGHRDHLLQELETALDQVNYWRHADKKPVMWRTLTNIFTRIDLTEQEIRSLHGLIRSLMRQEKE
jgi:tRNA/rRNA methyltransferase